MTTPQTETSSSPAPTQRESVKMLCDAIAEMAVNWPGDLVGEHREFYGKRITQSVANLARLFPGAMAVALTKAGAQ